MLITLTHDGIPQIVPLYSISDSVILFWNLVSLSLHQLVIFPLRCIFHFPEGF